MATSLHGSPDEGKGFIKSSGKTQWLEQLEELTVPHKTEFEKLWKLCGVFWSL